MLAKSCGARQVSLDRLVRDWANQLAPQSHRSVREIEQILRLRWHQYIVRELLDHSGPPKNGRRLAVQVLYAIGHAKFMEPRPLYQILPEIEHAIFPTEEDVIDFARQEKLPPYSWSNTTKAASQPSRPPESKLASEAMVKDDLRFVYNDAKAAGRKPPNINEVADEVQARLIQKGYWASKRWIKELAKADEFKRFRRARGKTLASERRKKLHQTASFLRGCGHLRCEANCVCSIPDARRQRYEVLPEQVGLWTFGKG